MRIAIGHRDNDPATPIEEDVALRSIRLVRYAMCWDDLDDLAQRQFRADLEDVDPNMQTVARSIAQADPGERALIARELIDVMFEILKRAAVSNEKIRALLEALAGDVVASVTGTRRDRVLPIGKG